MPTSNNGRYALSSANAIWSATITSTVAPLTSYSLTALKSRAADARVRFGATTVTITFTLASPVAADCFALPVSNLQGSVASLTNGAGLNVALPAMTLPATKIPKTAIVSFPVSTSNVWSLVISGNAEAVTLGGCVWLSQTNVLDRNFRYSWHEIVERFGASASNEYGTEYLVDYGTQARSVKCDFALTEAGAEQLKAWHQDGRWQPSLFWPNPLAADGYVGRWDSNFDLERAHPQWMPSALTFREIVKGMPV